MLDALDALACEPFVGTVWRVAPLGRDPLRGSASSGRWSPPGEFEVLYTSLARDGALAEVGYRLSLEPVWPSKFRHQVHELEARVNRTLRFANVASLSTLGIDPARYESLEYRGTQAIAAAAQFLEYDGLMVPSARGPFMNLVLFLDRLGNTMDVARSEEVDWSAWRKKQRMPTGRPTG